MNKLQVLIGRLNKLNIKIECTGNYPFVYLTKINGKFVKNKYQSEHGFVIGYFPIKLEQDFKFSNITKIFKLLKKYK